MSSSCFLCSYTSPWGGLARCYSNTFQYTRHENHGAFSSTRPMDSYRGRIYVQALTPKHLTFDICAPVYRPAPDDQDDNSRDDSTQQDSTDTPQRIVATCEWAYIAASETTVPSGSHVSPPEEQELRLATCIGPVTRSHAISALPYRIPTACCMPFIYCHQV